MPNHNPTGRGGFRKGQSGNPGGRANEQAFAEALRLAAYADDPVTGKRKLRLIAEKLVQEAIAGESWAIQQVADRLDGKAPQAIDVNMGRRNIKELSTPELMAIAAAAADEEEPAEEPATNGRVQ